MRIDPAGQRLHAAKLSRQRADNGLIINLNPPICHGLIQMADHIVADIAIYHLPRLRDIDFLQGTVKDGAELLRPDQMPRNIRVANAAFPRKKMTPDMLEPIVLCLNLMIDLPLDTRPVVHGNNIAHILLNMAAKLPKIAAVKQPQHFIIGIKQPIWLLRLCNEKPQGRFSIMP